MSAYFKSTARPILSVADFTGLRAEPGALLRTGQFSTVTGETDLFRYDEAETTADDGADYIKPTDVSGAGCWVRFAVGGASSPDFADHVLHVNVGGAPPSTGLYGISVNVTTGAARKGMFWAPDKSTWVAAEDTLGDDATISNYLAFRSLSLQADFFRSNAAAGVATTGAVRLGVAEEIKGVVSSTDYRLAAMLAGPVVALGDSTVATTTVDADTTLQLTSRVGAVNLRAATTFNVKDAAGSNTYFQTDTATGITKALPRLMVYDAVGTLVVLDVNAGTPAILVGGRIDTTAATPLGPLTLGGGNATQVTARIDGVGTAETTALLLANETAAAAGAQQRSGYFARRGYGWKTTATAASVMVEVGDQLRPVQGGAAPSAQWYFGYRIPGGTGSWSNYFFCDSNNSSFGVCVTASTFVTSAGGNGYRLTTNGGGVKESGGGRAIFQSAAAGEPWEALSSTSTGNTGGRFQFTADAGTPSAGYLARFGYGSGSFSTQVLGLLWNGRLEMANVDPTAAGMLGMDTTTGRARLFVGGVADSVAVLTDLGGGPIQSGRALLVSGVTAAISATVTASTRITFGLVDQVGATLSVKYVAFDADRAVGAPGSFKITAVVAAGTINTADGSTIEWHAVG